VDVSGARVILMIARVAGLGALVLGFVLWSGRGGVLVPIHMACGVTLVVALWALAVIAGRSGVSGGAVGMAILWGLAVPILGGLQLSLPKGGGYGVIRVAHPLLGLGAIGLAESMAARTRRVRAAPSR
jgi:hypothetical protein